MWRADTKLDLLSEVGVTLAERRLQQPAEPVSMAPLPPQHEAAEPPTSLAPPELPQPSRAEQSVRQFDELMDTFSLHHFSA